MSGIHRWHLTVTDAKAADVLIAPRGRSVLWATLCAGPQGTPAPGFAAQDISEEPSHPTPGVCLGPELQQPVWQELGSVLSPPIPGSLPRFL